MEAAIVCFFPERCMSVGGGGEACKLTLLPTRGPFIRYLF